MLHDEQIHLPDNLFQNLGKYVEMYDAQAEIIMEMEQWFICHRVCRKDETRQRNE